MDNSKFVSHFRRVYFTMVKQPKNKINNQAFKIEKAVHENMMSSNPNSPRV